MKKFVVGLFVALAAVTSQASYLWFTVQNDETGYSNIKDYLDSLSTSAGMTSDDVYAKVWAVKGEGESQTKVSLGEAGFTSKWQTDLVGNGVSLSDLEGGAGSYSYYVEICSNKAGYQSIGYNTTATRYDELVTLNAITDDLTPVSAANVWHGGSGGYKAAPEPTSAMLMLLGVAGLALKRKQKKA